ncbi:hypothetical protein [Streptosporangium sp. NPDC001681]|uniref:hypothetical protein n=1 Tax=Streptosporangium sp. NPDC001681 TaxID=3154395 RepID=UPI0033329447
MMSAPLEPGWETLCAEAEKVLDADAVHYEEQWLPDALARAAGWSAEVRRCPDRWFTTERDRVDLLLALGHVDIQTFGSTPRPSEDCWWMRTPDRLEFELPWDEDGPRQLDLQVARYVRDERERLAEEGTAVLNLLAEERGPKDPWDEGGLERFEPGATRYDFSDSVKVSATLPRFSMQFHDWAHMVNHWPYGQWQVDFAWDRVVGVRVGFRDYFMDMMPEP